MRRDPHSILRTPKPDVTGGASSRAAAAGALLVSALWAYERGAVAGDVAYAFAMTASAAVLCTSVGIESSRREGLETVAAVVGSAGVTLAAWAVVGAVSVVAGVVGGSAWSVDTLSESATVVGISMILVATTRRVQGEVERAKRQGWKYVEERLEESRGTRWIESGREGEVQR